MGDLSKHFNRSEFKCKCDKCDQDTVDHKLVVVLERLRSWADAPIIVTSGNRCPEYNKKIGGSPNSQHMRGRAADIVVQGFSPVEVVDILNYWYPDELGVGLYSGWVHVDSREGKARWTK